MYRVIIQLHKIFYNWSYQCFSLSPSLSLSLWSTADQNDWHNRHNKENEITYNFVLLHEAKPPPPLPTHTHTRTLPHENRRYPFQISGSSSFLRRICHSYGDRIHSSNTADIWEHCLPNSKIIDCSKLKIFGDEQNKCYWKLNFLFGRVENLVWKGENAGYQHFLLFPTCFHMASYKGSLKVGIVW